jgi:hypothetical protein
MAKKAKSDEPDGQGESIAGYFRKIFKENPKLLKQRSNEELLNRWLRDHPGQTEVPKSVKVGLQNVKSVLRSKKRKGGRRKAQEQPVPGAADIQMIEAPAEENPLELLEEQIDECLSIAKQLDREGLESVIQHLRRARNEVVWKLGE